MSLTDKQRAFIDEYLKDFNATRAAERAGYQGNDQTLAVVGWENLRKPNVRVAIDRRLAENAMSANEVLNRLADQARGSMADFLELVTDHMAIPNLRKAEQAGKLHLIRDYEHDPDRGVKIKLYDAQSALDKLAKAHGLYKQEEVGTDDRPFVVKVVKGVSTDDL